MCEVLRKVLGRWRLFKEIEPSYRYQTIYQNKRERGETSRYGRVLTSSAGLRSSSRVSRSYPRRVRATSSSS